MCGPRQDHPTVDEFLIVLESYGRTLGLCCSCDRSHSSAKEHHRGIEFGFAVSSFTASLRIEDFLHFDMNAGTRSAKLG